MSSSIQHSYVFCFKSKLEIVPFYAYRSITTQFLSISLWGNPLNLPSLQQQVCGMQFPDCLEQLEAIMYSDIPRSSCRSAISVDERSLDVTLFSFFHADSEKSIQEENHQQHVKHPFQETSDIMRKKQNEEATISDKD